MKVKVGSNWFEATKEQPIMVLLSQGHKRNIAQMHPDATMYALFTDDCSMTVEEKLAWMGGVREDESEEVSTPA